MSNKALFKGVDVSYANGKIDWDKASRNVDFAILKICNGYQKQQNVVDKQFGNNIAGCEKYGVPAGVYVYAYFTTVKKAREAAQFAIKLLNGRKLEYPIFLDLEEDCIRRLGTKMILNFAKAFCEEVEAAGYQYGTYANKYWFSNILTDSWYDKYIKWIAQYNSKCTYKGTLDIWQYTDTGSVPGINGNVDMNSCYTSFVKGDVNNDGAVTAEDARIILRVSAQLETFDSTQAEKNADVNGDGNIDAADGRDALRISAGVE